MTITQKTIFPKRFDRKAIAVLAALSLSSALVTPDRLDAGDFTFDWSVIDWPEGSLGPNTYTLTDQYGFQIDSRIQMSGIFESYGPANSPNDDVIFGGNVESLILVSDAPVGSANVGDATVSTTLSFSSGGIVFPVDGLELRVLDIDATDNNNASDRCDFVTLTGNNGNPLLTVASATPTVLVGPGPGSGGTGALAANQAQCIYVDGFGASPTSNNDDTGTIIATYPNDTSSTTIFYDESIGNVRPLFLGEDPAARGIGVLGDIAFNVDQSISLSRSVTPTTGLAGDSVTYEYVVTNNGALPFNTGQDLIIEDDLLGTVTCPAITAPVAPGGTVTCTAPYTITPADALTGSVNSNATAGIGAIGQPFATRLQSNTANLNVVTITPPGEPGPQTCSPESVFSKTRTQLAGPGSAAAPTTSDIFLYDDVTFDTNGNPIDIVMQLQEISNAINVEISSGLEARMVPADNGYVTYSLRLVQDGSATPSNPQGTPIELSRINGVIVQQTDVDSRGAGDDSSDVVGVSLTPTTLTHFNTAPLASFPAAGTAIAMDPAKTGDPTNWTDEPNETAFDNYVTYEFDSFQEGTFIHGYTGTSINPATRGSGILLCAIANTSPTVVAEDDDYTATPINSVGGGTTGEVMANDTINGLPATFLNATISVISEATPVTTGALVPTLVTSGVDEGRVVVPDGVPAGNYFIEYLLCDATDTTDCDRAKVTISVYDGNGFDFGDAPPSYLTASHGVPDTPVIYLGVVPPDAELVAQSDATATADDVFNIDDEDAVSFPILTQGTISTLDVGVTGNGTLQAWIDFNGDGLFEQTLGERIATDLRDDGSAFDNVAGDGVIQIDVAVPTDATTDTTFARFRYSTSPGLSPTDFAPDGEVEDYSLVIAAADLVDRGDAPASYGDPRHIIVDDIFLGAGIPDSETDPQNSVDADADDFAGADDEDSVAVFPVFEVGTTVSVTVQTHETLSLQYALGIPVTSGVTNLQAWIDFDQNGTFEPSEQVATNYRDGGIGDTDGIFNNQISFDVTVPNTISSGYTYARLRWSTSSALVSDPFDGLNFDGEVEDYEVVLSAGAVPFECDGTLYRVARVDSQLQRLVFSEDGSGGYTIDATNVGAPAGVAYNGGWGYNAVDGLFYGVREFERDLVQLDSTGKFTVVSTLPPTAATGYNSGDILSNGIMIYRVQGTNDFQLLDITDPTNPIDAGLVTLTSAVDPFDIAFNPNDGMIYGVNHVTDRLFYFDPADGAPGTRTPVEFGPAIWTEAYGAIWFDFYGRMYVNQNTSNEMYEVDVGIQGNGTGNRELISVITISEEFRNDGAGCPSRLGPLPPEGALAGTVYEDTDGSGAFDNGETGIPNISVDIYNDNGTPGTIVDDVLVTSVVTAADGSYLVENLSALNTYRIEVEDADADMPAGYQSVTPNPLTAIRVTAGSTRGGLDFGFAPGEADLSITKTVERTSDGATVTSAAEGTELEFVISVTNSGPASVASVLVNDILPSGFAYVSDDAASQGNTYNASTGRWDVGGLAIGETKTLRITVTMLGSGNHTNIAEIIFSSVDDPDSDPSVGTATDDLSDGIPDDDEASVTVALDNGERLLSGRVFIDNGVNSGTAHDAIVNGSETGTQSATLTILDGSGSVIATPTIAADGSWAYALDGSYSGPLSVSVAPLPGFITVSENDSGLPALANSDPHDGNFTFTPDASSNYSGLNIGIVRAPTLTRDQEASVESGQVATLQHEYTAFTSGTVTFSYANPNMAPPNSFSATLYRDTDCDTTPDTPINAPITVSAGDRLCLVSRVTANSGIGPGSSYTYDLVASTALSATTVVSTSQNTDRIVAGGGAGRLELRKTVRNITQNTPEGASNGGAIGDVLRYQIYLRNPSSAPATNVIIYDKTPSYTALASPIASPTTLGNNLICVVSQPTNNVAGYVGPLRWDCTGTYEPGEDDSVFFDVVISP
ncbi:GEVED domain-containing protein [Loktanella sp. S4079]|uniref:GEVED domain-containing protein n=1 Tax=Loktanella sp. S4079 TaxID=579483 RepID=UPI001EF4DAD9|nr:GEVED domain-containing protein [Loktanella sp. S4079]